MNKVLFLLYFCFVNVLDTKHVSNKLPKNKLVIDHDGGADDAMAIFLCILYEKYYKGPELVALTTVHGNVNETQVFDNSQRFLDITDRRDVPIYRGATRALVIPFESDYYFGKDGLGDNEDLQSVKPITAEKQHAAIGLIELSKKYEGQLIVMAIGPQTNIALAQRLDPDFIGRLKQLYVGAGHIHSKIAPKPEFNAEMDVEAFKIVTDSATPDKVTTLPFSQVLATLNISKEWRENILGSIQTPIVEALNKFERISLAHSDRWIILDPAVAAAVLVDRGVVDEYKYSDTGILTCGTNRGINTNYVDAKDPNVRLVYSYEQENYKNLLINVFSAPLNNCHNKYERR